MQASQAKQGMHFNVEEIYAQCKKAHFKKSNKSYRYKCIECRTANVEYLNQIKRSTSVGTFYFKGLHSYFTQKQEPSQET